MQKSKCKVQKLVLVPPRSPLEVSDSRVDYGGSPTAQRGRTIDNILRLEWRSTKLFVDSYELFVPTFQSLYTKKDNRDPDLQNNSLNGNIGIICSGNGAPHLSGTDFLTKTYSYGKVNIINLLKILIYKKGYRNRKSLVPERCGDV